MGMVGDAVQAIMPDRDAPGLAFRVMGGHHPWQAFDFAVLVAGGQYEAIAYKCSRLVTMGTPWITCE